MTADLHFLVARLFSLRAIKLGSFTLKNELKVPLKVELSALLAAPKVLESLAEHLAEKATHYQPPLLCGAPNIGLVLTTLVGTRLNLPFVAHQRRGANQVQIEGVFKSGSRCLVISDLLEPRAELFDTLDALEQEGLAPRDLLVVFDWQQGGKEKLRERGIQLHSLLSVQKATEILAEAGKIDGASSKLLSDFFDTPAA